MLRLKKNQSKFWPNYKKSMGSTLPGLIVPGNLDLLGGGFFPSSVPPTLLTNILAYWTLNESSGNRIDSTGNGNTMVPTGSVGTTSGFGNVGNASTFDGSTAFLSTLAALPSSTPWTIAGWVNFGSVASREICYSFTQTSANYLSYNLSFEVFAGGIATGGTYTANTGIWYHYVAVSDGTSLKSYVNGNLNSTSSFLPAAYGPGIFGKQSSFFLTGSLVGWGVWSRVLSITGILNLYNGGNGVAYASLGSLAG